MEEVEGKKRARGALASSPGFREWWESYPHKVGKGAAEKSWQKAIKQVSVAELITAVDRYKRHKPPDCPWCNPATWLNQKRWLDLPAGQCEPEPQHDRPNGPPPRPEEIWPDFKDIRH